MTIGKGLALSADPWKWDASARYLVAKAVRCSSERVCIAALDAIKVAVQAYAAASVLDEDDRDDLVNEAVCAAWILLSTGDDDTAARAEAFAVARRLSAAWKRRRRAEVVGDSALALLSAPACHRRLQFRLALWEYEDEALLSHLTEPQRAALELHVMDDLPDGEIGALSASTRDAVRTLRHTAKRRLRQLLEDGVIPSPPDDHS